MPPNHFESEVESFLEGSHGDRTHIKRADHHTVTPLCGTLLRELSRTTRNVEIPTITIQNLKQPQGNCMRNCQAIAPSPAQLEGAGGTGGPGRGAGGRRRGLAGLRDRPLRAAGSRVAISRAGRRPRAHTAARPIKAGHAAAGDLSGQQAAPPQRAEGNPYSPRNALIVGISRTACTRPAR